MLLNVTKWTFAKKKERWIYFPFEPSLKNKQ